MNASEKLQASIERFKRTGPDVLQYQVTIDDPELGRNRGPR